MCLFFQAEDGIRDLVRSRGLGDVYKRQVLIPFRGPHLQNAAGAEFENRDRRHLACSVEDLLSLIHI
mgnify:CR=1 FL=1